MSSRRSWIAVGLLAAGASLGAQSQFSGLGHPVLSGAPGHARALAAADLDGDTWPEVVVANGGAIAEQNRLLKVDGRGGIIDITGLGLPAAADASQGLAAGDVDGDGDLDLVIANHGPNRLLVNDGRARFRDSPGLPFAFDNTDGVVLFDADGDGDLDLFAANLGQDRLYRNDGSGVFRDVTAAALPPDGSLSAAAAAGDVDGDGDLDLVVANRGSPGADNALLLNDGTGSFRLGSALPSTNDASAAVVLADVDGDGALDIAIANAGQDRLLLNDGRGGFRDVTAARCPATGGVAVDLAAVDLDGDGDVDLVFGELGSVVPWLNDGSGLFATAPARVAPIGTSVAALLFADLDGDLDADLAIGTDGNPDLVQWNLHRQLDGAATAAAGSSYVLDVHAMPGFQNGPQVALPWASLGRSIRGIALPVAGRILLDPTTLVAGRPVLVGASGLARVSLPVPPGMAGLTVHLQAVVLHGTAPLDWRMSNAITVAVR